MSNLLSQASLVMIPSGYKEDVVYSQIPTNGNGDLSFTRASNGTRINSAGLVEDCPWNLFTYSEQFQNADWIGGGSGRPTMTDNFAEAPNGTMTASKMEVAGSGYQLRQNTAIENTQMNVSVWLRTNTGTKTIQLILNDGVTALQNITVTTTWTRYEVSGLVTTLAGSGRNGLQTTEALTSGAYILVWGLQTNLGLTAKPYFPTTDRLNVPRLTYQNGGGGCPSLLLEKQSTNLCTYSEQLDNGVYTQSNVSVTANQAISPDGTQNADTITSSASIPQLISPAVSFASSTSVSLFVKYVSQKYVQLFSGGAFGDYVNFDIESGAVGSNGGTTTNAKIENFGNGWYRISATFGGYTGATTARLGFVDSLTAGWNSLTTTTNKLIYAWGFQIEASSYPTSYIPTTSASATRVADACFKTGISSLIGQTEGVLFVDINYNGENFGLTNNFYIYIGDGNNTDAIYIDQYDNKFRWVVFDGTTIRFYTDVAMTTGRHKLALAYKNNDYSAYLDGTLITTQTLVSGAVPTCSQFSLIGNVSNFDNNVKQVNEAVLFKTRLTNAELASLTTI